MLYTVEIDFTSEAHFADWNAWYNGNLPLIVTVPGIGTAQRLETTSGNAPRYLAIYAISGPDVFESQPYLAIGGGGAASSKWKDYIKRRRNVYSGLDAVPEITNGALLGVIDRDPAELDLPDLLFVPLLAEALARSPERRYLTVLHDAKRRVDYERAAPDLAFYTPLTERYVTPVRVGS